jgi:hypothetical protein
MLILLLVNSAWEKASPTTVLGNQTSGLAKDGLIEGWQVCF